MVEVIFILDRSGSMAGMEPDTIGGFNSTLESQRKEHGEVLWSTVLFDNQHEVIHDRVPIEKIEKLTEREYYVRGCTALLDAIGRAVKHIGNVHKYARAEDVPEKTLFVITTDGMENASKEYSYKEVKRMIERQSEKYGWEFLFLGANMDAVSEAGRMGIRPERAATFLNDSEGIALNYQVIDRAMRSVRRTCSVDDDILFEVREDYAKR
ncbi:MAG: VWA domain-containing protein [Firmicutes bacterium]|nr:VWA domain-containing protein [Bacillota bacterium]